MEKSYTLFVCAISIDAHIIGSARSAVLLRYNISKQFYEGCENEDDDTTHEKEWGLFVCT